MKVITLLSPLSLTAIALTLLPPVPITPGILTLLPVTIIAHRGLIKNGGKTYAFPAIIKTDDSTNDIINNGKKLLLSPLSIMAIILKLLFPISIMTIIPSILSIMVIALLLFHYR